MRNVNFNEILETAMNTANKTSRDKGLLENALTMTSFSMPSQADVIDYEITLLTEKQNQIYQHIEELASEASERLTEMYAERAEIVEEMKFYQREYSEALRRKQYSARVYGRESLQAEKYAAAFVFACDLYTKAENQLHAIDNEIAELETLAANTRAWLTGNAPSVAPTTTDDLPFESTAQPAATAKAISREQFSEAVNALLEKQEVLSSIEQYCNLDAAQLADSLKENSRSDKQKVKSALEYAIYGSAQDEATADALTDAIEQYFEDVVDDVQEALEEYAAPLPSQRRIDANIGGVYRR